MVNQKIMPKVYKEVYEIVKHVPEEDFNKIPKEILEKIHAEMDKEYEYYIDFDNFQNQEMLYETQLILAMFFRDYWATEEQKRKIKAKERYDEQVNQENLREQYNPNDLFHNKRNHHEIKIENVNTETAMVEYKENIFQKIQKFIKNIFNKK